MSEKGTYWNNSGKYQTELDRLWGRLVPSEGPAETSHGELLRAAMRLYHDYYNNGFINLMIGSYTFGFYGVLCLHDFEGAEELEAWRQVTRAIQRHLKSEDDDRESDYIKKFPEAAFETVMDAVIHFVADRDAAPSPAQPAEAK